MPNKLTDAELTAERNRAQALADLCGLHGRPQGQHAMLDVVESIKREQAERSRG